MRAGDYFIRPKFEEAKEIPWIIEEQTQIKHTLLKKYIDPWMSILLSQQSRSGKKEELIYFDGFSGPGIYWRDCYKRAKCLGSPLIVANVAKKYLRSNPNRKIAILCTDKNRAAVEYLDFYLKRFNRLYNQHWETYHTEFDGGVNKLLNSIENNKMMNPPIFFFIDPFGYTGFPMVTLRRIMENPLVELFINLDVYDINRWICEDQQNKNMVDLFASDDFRKAVDIDDTEERYLFIRNLYCDRLHNFAGANFVMPFRVNTPHQTGRARYYLIHASKNFKALKLMKDTMAANSHLAYGFEAIGVIKNQENLFEDPEKVKLRENLIEYLTIAYPRQLDYETLEYWAYINTEGYSKTIKMELMDLEKHGIIKIERKYRQRKNTVTNGACILLTDF